MAENSLPFDRSFFLGRTSMLVRMLKKVITLGIIQRQDLYHKNRIILTNQVTIIFMLSLIVRLGLDFFKHEYAAAFLTFGIILLGAFTFVFTFHRRYATARLYLLSLLIFISYAVLMVAHEISYTNLIGFYFIELYALIVFLLLFDRHYDDRLMYYFLYTAVVLNIFIHDQFYFYFLGQDYPWVTVTGSDSYLYFKMPQLAVSLILIAGLHVWKENFRSYIVRLQQKHQEIQDKNDQIVAQNEKLSTQTEELVKNNHLLRRSQEEVSFMNANLEYLIKQRTELIKSQHEKLIEYTYYNAHKVRGPLARILGILELMKIDKSIDVALMLSLMNQAATELDQKVKEINTTMAPHQDTQEDSESCLAS